MTRERSARRVRGSAGPASGRASGSGFDSGSGGEGRAYRDLEAYADGELGWWGRRRVEARLRRSPELVRELEWLRAMGDAAATADVAAPTGDLWSALEGRLAEIDEQGERASRRDARREPAQGRAWLVHWRPAGLAVAAASAAALAIAVWMGPGLGTEEPRQGALRYLDTAGQPVVVVDDRDGVIIVWLMDAAPEPGI